MNGTFFRLPRFMSPLGSSVFGVSVIITSILFYQGSWGSASENTRKANSRITATADQQKMSPADRKITQKIRKAIHRDKNLSAEARNIKIFAQDGRVTLRGPVRSEEEKINLEAKAIDASGRENVTDQLEVALPH